MALALYVALVAAGLIIGRVLPDLSGFTLRPGNEPEVHRTIMGLAALYVLAMAVPFVPGVEIGLALLVVFGGRIALLVYLATVAALSLAFLAGRLVPTARLSAGFRWLGLARAASLVERTAGMTPSEHELAIHGKGAGAGMAARLLRHRHAALALALNMPGNALAGGGGGIALAAGMSGLFSPAGFLLTLTLAVSPVPLAFLLAA